MNAKARRILAEAKGWQLLQDGFDKWKREHGGLHPFETERAIQPTLRAFDLAGEAFVGKLERYFHDADEARDHAQRLRVLLDEVRAAHRTGYLREPPRGRGGRASLLDRRRLVADLVRAGVKKEEARALATADGLRAASVDAVSPIRRA